MWILYSMFKQQPLWFCDRYDGFDFFASRGGGDACPKITWKTDIRWGFTSGFELPKKLRSLAPQGTVGIFCMFLAPSELRSLAPQGTVGIFIWIRKKIKEKKGSRTILHTSYLIYVQDIVFGNLRSLRYQLASYFGSRGLRLFSLSCLRT